jgi:hypothetical protein
MFVEHGGRADHQVLARAVVLPAAELRDVQVREEAGQILHRLIHQALGLGDIDDTGRGVLFFQQSCCTGKCGGLTSAHGKLRDPEAVNEPLLD